MIRVGVHLREKSSYPNHQGIYPLDLQRRGLAKVKFITIYNIGIQVFNNFYKISIIF
jgi:hypothetical protein